MLAQICRILRWGLLPMSVLATAWGQYLDIKEVAEYSVPSWGWYSVGYLLLALFFIAVIVGYRRENKRLEVALSEAKLYEAKSQRIEIISKERYPTEILRILDDMRRSISNIIENVVIDKSVVNSKSLVDSVHITPHELYLAIHQRTVDENIANVYTFYMRFGYEIGLIALQEKDNAWKKLVDEFETVKKDVPDQRLKEYIGGHYKAINGAGAVRLYYRYLREVGASEMAIKSVEHFRPYSDLLDQTMTRVTKRILELKLGEEPKWETRYYELR